MAGRRERGESGVGRVGAEARARGRDVAHRPNSGVPASEGRAEDPGPQHREAEDGGDQRRHGQRQSSGSRAAGAIHCATTRPSVVKARLTSRGAVTARKRPRGSARRRAGQLAVHGRVEQRGDGEGHRVGAERAEQRAPGQEEEQVAQRGDTPTPAKRSSWSAATCPARGGRIPWDASAASPDAAQVVGGGRDDVHARVGVVDPVDGDLADAQAQPLGGDEQLGVEEPLVVLDEREQLLGRIAPQRLEAALGVAEAPAQRQRSSRLYAREMSSRLGPRTTCAPLASREPMATSLWPESSGATSGSSGGERRSTGRRPCRRRPGRCWSTRPSRRA